MTYRQFRPARSRTTARRTEPTRPTLPDDLAVATIEEHELEPEATFRAVGFTDIDLAESRAEGIEFIGCRFQSASLARSRLVRPRLRDCLVDRCDWSNLAGEGGRLDRVALADSRITGLVWTDGLVRDVVFRDCRLDLSNWRETSFDVVRFVGCNLAGADFSGADLRRASFTGCNLTRAQFSKAAMSGARFRRCELEGIGGITSWDGAIVHPDDLLALSYVLAGALGIVITEDGA